jgi:hypothetical protein
MRGLAAAALACACLEAVACKGGSSSVAPNEPIQVAGGQFIAGVLPGMPPWVSVDGAAQDPAELTHLAIDDAVSRPFGPLVPGAAHQQFSGFATQDAVAIGVTMADEGTGYWVVPVGGLNPQLPGKVDWEYFADFNPQDPPGRHKLRLVAIDAAGGAGRQVEVPVCIDSLLPDNGHTCIPDRVPPAAVISLQWDDDFDLDLHVVTPDGVDISAKAPQPPTDGQFDGGAPDGGVPAVDRDSLVACVPDGFRQEDLIFQSPPVPGIYRIYAKPFAACGQMAVRFTVNVYALTGACPDCGLEASFTQSGELLASQAVADTTSGLFIHEVELPQGP